MAFQHPSLYLSKFEEGLGVFVQPDAEDIPAETVVLRAPVLVSDSDAELNHAQRCMKLALALRDVDADERDALCPRDNEPSEEEPYRNDMRKRAAELMEAPEEERALYAAGVDFAAMDAEQKNQILWNFEKALFNMFHTPHGSFLFRGMGHYINHSCMPNSVWTVDPQNGELTVKTVKTVTEGEEITVGYFAIRDSKVDIIRELSDYYGFTCHCDPCMMVYRMIDPDRFPPDDDRKVTIEKPLRFSQMPYLFNWYTNTCTWCGKRPEKLLSCSRCQSAKFCNRECQAADWAAIHKGFCPTMKEWRESGVIKSDKKEEAQTEA